MNNIKPNLFVLGVAKSGTTTLYSILKDHPQVFMSAAKEPRFFSRDSIYAKGESWYLKNHFLNSYNWKIRGEATPTYFSLHEKTIPRLKKFLGDETAKFIIIFRNPIDRAYSHYWFNYNTRISSPETLSFAKALESEELRKQNHPEYYKEGIISFNYLETGYFIKNLEPFIEAFGKNNFLFLLFEDLFEEQFSNTVKTITNFLCIEEFNYGYSKNNSSVQIKNIMVKKLWRKLAPIRKLSSPFFPKNFNSFIRSLIKKTTERPFNYPVIDPSDRKKLTKRYALSIRLLEKVIERDLSHWTTN